MFTTDLAQVPSLQLVERARLSDVVGELKLGKTSMRSDLHQGRIYILSGV